MSEIVKEIEIESALRPRIFLSPKATQRGVPITMVARKDKESVPALSYERDFGDGSEQKTVSSRTAKHTYDAVGSYLVTLVTYGPNNQKNTVTDMVFIGEKNSPIPSYEVRNSKGTILKQVANCGENPAYQVDRQEIITIDASKSVNTQ